MAFIKRSTITPVTIKVGKHMLKCLSCGKPFVSKLSTNLCQNCIPKIVSRNGDNLKEEVSEFDLGQE